MLSSFLAFFGHDAGISLYPSLLDTHYPSVYTNNITNTDFPAETNSQIGGKSLVASRNDRLGHCFIQNRRDDSAMNDPLVAFRTYARSSSGKCSQTLGTKLKMQAMRILIAADKTIRIPLCTRGFRLQCPIYAEADQISQMSLP